MVSLDTLMSNHTMESIARVFACRTLEHRLVLLGLTRYHEALVDGLPLWRELQSTYWHSFFANKRLLRMLVEPRCSLNILFNEGADLVVRKGRWGIRRFREQGCRRMGVECAWGARGGLNW